MYRKTYAEIDGNILRDNVVEIKTKYSGYDYYFGVVKANAYSHGFDSIKYLLAGGINYLAVSSLEEAIEVRKLYKDTPILILEPIHYEDILVASEKDITVTIDSVDIFNKLKENNIAVKFHIKVDSGMNRFGLKNKEDVKYMFDNSNSKLYLEGIFTQFGSVGGESFQKELDTFKEITSLIDLKKVPIVHLERSLSLECHKKLSIGNGVRLGISMYGFGKIAPTPSWKRKIYNLITFKKSKPTPSILNIRPALKFYTEVLEIRDAKPGENIGYNGMYKADKPLKIAILPYGFADYAHIKPSKVVINGNLYETITNYMDITVAVVDDTVKVGDRVEIFGDVIPIRSEARKLGINVYKVICGITSRVPRVYKYDENKKPIVKNKDFRALIIGNDMNAYYLARCYHEYTGKKADLLALKMPSNVKTFIYTRYTNILNLQFVENMWDEKVFLNALNEYYEKYKEQKILLISSNETYNEFIMKNDKILRNKFFYNCPDLDVMMSLVIKEKFYKTYANSCLDLPITCYYDCTSRKEFTDKITYPVILKPSNVIMFKHMDFVGKKKVYKLESQDEVNKVIGYFKKGGYTDTLIIQEYIPGDDSHLFDAVCYSDKNKEIKLVSFAQIGLQEHESKLIGNAAILINGYSQYDGVKEQIEKICSFMNSIGYRGFAEFDMKYDERDKKYKVLEINARQGRSSYYITPCGYNLIEILARDLIDGETLEFNEVNKVQLETFIPKFIVKKYISNEEYVKKALSLWKNKVNPFIYKRDTSFLRKLAVLKILYYHYYKAYKNSKWDWK